MVHLLSNEGQVSLVVEQDSSLSQDRFASRSKWQTQVDWRRFRKECNRLAVLQNITVSPTCDDVIRGTARCCIIVCGGVGWRIVFTVFQVDWGMPYGETQVKLKFTVLRDPDKWNTKMLRKRRHSLTILELFIMINRDLIAAWLSAEIEMWVRGAQLTRIHWAAR